MRQHHIPRSILRHFSDADGKIWMYRRGGTPRKTGTKNVAVKNNQYKTIHDKKPEGYEKLLAGLEDWLRPAVEKVISEESLPSNPQELSELTMFTSLQYARSPHVRELMRNVVAPHVVATSNSQLDVAMAKGLTLYPECDFPMFVDVYHGLASSLDQLPIFLLRNTDNNFVCPDDPVFLQFEDKQNANHADKGDSQRTITRALFPISSRLLIQFGGSDREPTHDPISVDTNAVVQWNQDSVCCSRVVYGRSRELVEVAAKGWLRQEIEET